MTASRIVELIVALLFLLMVATFCLWAAVRLGGAGDRSQVVTGSVVSRG
jgi:hypothetical protein